MGNNISFKDGPLAQNRTEELGYDLWESFVVPPYYPYLDILNSKKPKVIIGGRGCGKTMLLRYLSHNTKFSKSRIDIEKNEIAHIGIYWRVDTQFASLMNNRSLAEDKWQRAFEHMATIIISLEIIKSLESISQSQYEFVTEKSLADLNLADLKPFDPQLPENLHDLSLYLKKNLRYFQSWLNNIRKIEEPLFYPKSFIDSFIQIVQSQIVIFKESSFCVYLDEYENLIDFQRRLVNTWLKHSEPPLIFNLAMKPDSFPERNTVGNEQISDIHDFRIYPIEEYLRDDGIFEVFAAEILFSRLYAQGVKNLPITPSILKDPSKISERKKPDYIDRIKKGIEFIFPSMSREQLVDEIFNEPSLKSRLDESLKRALEYKNSKLSHNNFIDPEFKEASLVNISLIYRDKPGLESITSEFNKLRRGEVNSYTGKTEWLSNNFYGSYLFFFEPLNRPCKFYSGYSTFCLLSRGNIRYILELCHKSLIRGEEMIKNKEVIGSYAVSADNQAEAARQASKTFLEEVKTYGRLGNHLYIFVLRLGTLFHHAHKRLTQSEPEINHFSIDQINIDERESIKDFVNEALKWSVLFIEKSTKEKTESATEFKEFVLNPIYAPYFHISYRKKRKLSFSNTEFVTLIEGNADQYDILLKSFLKKWSLGDESTGLLFPEY